MKFSSSVNVAKPFDTYDEKKFRERFRLSKIVVKCLLDEVTIQLHSFITPVISFINFDRPCS